MAEETNVTETKEEVQEQKAPAEETKDEKKIESEAAKEKEAESAAAPKEPEPPKPIVHKTNFEKDVVYLFQFSRTPVVPSMSPYCLKVETWLRLAGLKYEVSNLIILYMAAMLPPWRPLILPMFPPHFLSYSCYSVILTTQFYV